MSEEDGMGVAGTSAGVTMILGAFQSARFNCWMALPCKASEAKPTFQKCLGFVNEKLEGEIKKVYVEHQELKGI